MKKTLTIALVSCFALSGLAGCDSPQEERVDEYYEQREEALEQDYEQREEALEQEQELMEDRASEGAIEEPFMEQQLLENEESR